MNIESGYKIPEWNQVIFDNTRYVVDDANTIRLNHGISLLYSGQPTGSNRAPLIYQALGCMPGVSRAFAGDHSPS